MTDHSLSTNARIFGLILMGGKSSRMGYNKSMIEFYGKPQRDYLFELLTTCCDQVFTSCKTLEQIPASLNPLADQYEMESPLNGILSAFKKQPDVAWLTVPVDMPLIDTKTLQFLIAHRSNKHVATCFYDSDGEKPEPLLTLWEPEAASLLFNFYNSGQVSPRNFLQHAKVNMMLVPDANVLTNINSQEELIKFKANS